MRAILVNFNNAEHESLAKKAHDRLYFYLNKAHFALKDSEIRSDREQLRFKTWFGKINETHLDRVRDVIRIMHDAFEDNNIQIHFGGNMCNIDTYAYVTTDDIKDERYIIHLCNLFFEINDKEKFDTAMGTVIHELSHLSAGTEDHIYGKDKCEQLAIENSNLSVNNADSYQYYCESFIK